MPAYLHTPTRLGKTCECVDFDLDFELITGKKHRLQDGVAATTDYHSYLTVESGVMHGCGVR